MLHSQNSYSWSSRSLLSAYQSNPSNVIFCSPAFGCDRACARSPDLLQRGPAPNAVHPPHAHSWLWNCLLWHHLWRKLKHSSAQVGSKRSPKYHSTFSRKMTVKHTPPHLTEWEILLPSDWMQICNSPRAGGWGSAIMLYITLCKTCCIFIWERGERPAFSA